MLLDLYIYDIETYPNCFTFACEHYATGDRWLYELSFRKWQGLELWGFLQALKHRGAVMVGFNNINFDYPVCHELIQAEGAIHCDKLYEKAQAIITSNSDFAHTIWPSDRHIPQLDLYKINHFDNQAKRTGLKQIEFNMRVPNIADLPYEPGTLLDSDQIDNLIRYNMDGDVANTREFLKECMPAIEFRQDLSERYGRDFMNHNDTKVGKDYFIMSLEAAGIPCYRKEPGQSRQPIQTQRPVIALKDAVLPYIQFNHPEFQRIHQWFLDQVIIETKGVFTDVSCTIDSFTYDFGLGGIHGSVESQTVHSDDEWIIEDWDVASYYPNLAIANRVYPEHLTDKFCDIYRDVYLERKQHPKGSPENAVMKLALNGVYGDSNNRYSPFYDPLYTMTITINGQLLLCMLADKLREVNWLQMIQINTDGLTVRYRRVDQPLVHGICKWWERFTQLELEHVEYRRMFIRDVNNYIGEYTNGKLKRKGAYEYDREHHQNHSALIVPKVAEAALVRGENIEDAVRSWPDIMDFMIRAKATGGTYLDLDGVKQQRTCRYYVSKQGGTLLAVRPPPAGKTVGDFKKKQGVSDRQYAAYNQTGVHNPEIHTKNQSVYGETKAEQEKGWKVTVCNDIMDCVNPVNHDYYIERVKKLVEPLR